MSVLSMQCLLGVRCHDFVMMASDQTEYVTVILNKDDQDKIHKINDSLMLGVIGDNGDSAQLTQYITKNVQLYRMRNSYEMDMDAVVHFTRNSLAETAKNNTPYLVGILLGGYDKVKGPQLFYMDYLAACVSVPYTVHGLGGIISLGVIKSLYRSNLTEREAYELMRACVAEIQTRFIVNLHKFQVAVVDARGVRYLKTIVASEFRV